MVNNEHKIYIYYIYVYIIILALKKNGFVCAFILCLTKQEINAHIIKTTTRNRYIIYAIDLRFCFRCQLPSCILRYVYLCTASNHKEWTKYLAHKKNTHTLQLKDSANHLKHLHFIKDLTVRRIKARQKRKNNQNKKKRNHSHKESSTNINVCCKWPFSIITYTWKGIVRMAAIDKTKQNTKRCA